jgi:hypothetical protein
MNYLITGKNFTSPLVNNFKNKKDFLVINENDLKKTNIFFDTEDKIYCPDETSVPFLKSKISSEQWEKLEIVKNKNQCRLLLKNLYPDFFFTSVNLNKLAEQQLPAEKEFIIKPQKGFFGVGIREIDNNIDLKKIAEDIKKEIFENAKIFSDDVFTQNDFIIEEYICGEEYSFDLYYNQNEEPVFTSMCHHPLSKHKEYFHLLYYTNKKIYDNFFEQVNNIFIEFNKTLHLKNIPIHAEFKENNGRLIPIEFNIPRFGGFGLADLPYYAFGENPFEHFFYSTAPDWKKIFEHSKDKYYAWILCYNGKDIDTEIYEPDYDKISKHLGNVIHIDKIDYTKNPVFAIAYVEFDNRDQINKILETDFNDFFKPKTHFVSL